MAAHIEANWPRVASAAAAPMEAAAAAVPTCDTMAPAAQLGLGAASGTALPFDSTHAVHATSLAEHQQDVQGHAQQVVPTVPAPASQSPRPTPAYPTGEPSAPCSSVVPAAAAAIESTAVILNELPSAPLAAEVMEQQDCIVQGAVAGCTAEQAAPLCEPSQEGHRNCATQSAKDTQDNLSSNIRVHPKAAPSTLPHAQIAWQTVEEDRCAGGTSVQGGDDGHDNYADVIPDRYASAVKLGLDCEL